MLRVGIIGGTGYTGGELLRLLSIHPRAEITVVTSRKQAGMRVDSVHKNLKDLVDLKFEDLDIKTIGERCDIVFTAVPHGAAMSLVPGLVDCGCRVIDLSADYRLPADKYEQVYKKKQTDPRECVYGLPEMHPEVKDATVVANPGCFPTGAILAGSPLVATGEVDRIVFDSKTGVSGAGQDPTETTHFPNVTENIKPYNITTHRHKAEIEQELGRLSAMTRTSFTPHLIPAVRGILTTAHVFMKREMSEEEVKKTFHDYYGSKPFVRMNAPSLSTVRGSNFCDIAFEVDKGTDRIVVISAIDNMVKGASGQAIQNMNIMFGFDERTGLWTSGLSP
jgi:N-acetyl-gamma-glutamyl-phosphate reductase